MKTKEFSIKEDLPVYFTDEEKVNICDSMAHAMAKKEKIETDIKRFKDDRKPMLEEYASQIKYQSDLIIRGYDLKEVECHVLINYETKRKTITRKDTGEIVREEPLTVNDMQIDLFEESEKPINKMREVI